MKQANPRACGIERLIFFMTLNAFLFLSSVGYSQIRDSEDETELYAETKQLNQFFRRFNGEEDEKGKRYYPQDRQYRSAKLRRQYLGMLFDAANTSINRDLASEFIRHITDKDIVLNFHGGQWFSEVNAVFTMNGRDHTITLFMEIEKHLRGSRWVISRVYADMFESYFRRDTTKVGQFLHPLSHELAFMNMRKAFSYQDSVSQLAVKRFRPDHLSVFLYEVQRGNLKFRSVDGVKFHFFQIDGWYFELSDFNREGLNTGWLISNLVKVDSEADKAALRKHLYYEK
ncbi:MAG TPA: hypothetical protein VD927_03275 [Chryseosolibacter sp.]|nr:hypothetical protein [Chryseosolibacter sp.]